MAQNYEIDIKRFNGQDYDTLLPTPAAHAATHQANGSDPLTLQTGNYGDLSIPTSAYQDASVTRAKLAQDALYSPWVSMSGTTTLGAEHIGKTFRSSSGSIDFILNVGLLGNTIPSAAEFGVFRNWAKTFKIVFAEGTSVALDGENSYLRNPTVSIPNNNQMVALKKILTDSGKDYWLVTGNVEVVS